MRRLLMRKWKDHRGFTLTELLITVLILVMVSGVVAAGVPAAASAYRKVVDNANALLLLSTAKTALRDQLETAKGDIFQPKDPETGAVLNDSISYYSVDTLYTTLCIDPENGITLRPYETLTRDATTGAISAYVENAEYTRPLVSRKAVTENLRVQFQSVTYDNMTGLFTVTGLTVIRTVNGESYTVAGSDTDVYYIKAENMLDH